MKVKADLHNHFTTRSLDLPQELVTQVVSRRLGYGGICGFANFGDRRYEAWAKKTPNHFIQFPNAVFDSEKYVWVIKGEEIRTKEGDLLLVGVDEGVHPKHHRPLEDTLMWAQDNDAIVIATEPFSRSEIGNILIRKPDLLNQFDAIQVHDAQLLPYQNERAKIFYMDVRPHFPHLGQIACTDDHNMRPGNSYILTEPITSLDASDRDDLREELRSRVRQTRDSKNLHCGYAPLSAAHHVAALAGCIAASKVGLNLNDPEAILDDH